MFHQDFYYFLRSSSVSSPPKLKMEKNPSYYFLTSGAGLPKLPTFSFIIEVKPV